MLNVKKFEQEEEYRKCDEIHHILMYHRINYF